MPVDNDTIKTKMDALDAKADELQSKLGEVRHTRTQLNAIYEKTINMRDPADPKKHIQVQKIEDDPGTGAALTPARRQEIYDACIAEADRLLA